MQGHHHLHARCKFPNFRDLLPQRDSGMSRIYKGGCILRLIMVDGDLLLASSHSKYGITYDDVSWLDVERRLGLPSLRIHVTLLTLRLVADLRLAVQLCMC